MGRKDASASRIPVEQYRKQIDVLLSAGILSAPSSLTGRQDYKKNKPVLRATRLKAEAKKTAIGIKEVVLVIIALLVFLLAFYTFFYLNMTVAVDSDEDSSN
ncbi:hypothetical protein FKM82_005959 [Ascaphus truei]